MSHTWDNLPLKVTNVLAFVVFLSSSTYSSLVPHDSRWGAGPHETYLTPSAWLFVVWPVIHLGLLAMQAYQFTDAGYDSVVKTVGWRFPILAVLTSLYSYWNARPTTEHPHRLSAMMAFVALLLSTMVVSAIYRDVRARTKSDSTTIARGISWGEALCVQWPFSLYHGFNAVLLAVAAFSAFGVNANEHKAGVLTDISAFVVLMLLETTAVGYVYYGNGDAGGAVVIAAGLLAIAEHQQHARFIHWTALLFFVLSLLALGKAGADAQQRNRHWFSGATDEERAPVLGEAAAAVSGNNNN